MIAPVYNRWLITILILLNSMAYGQTLTLDDLFKLQTIDFVTVNDVLTSKGWDFSDSKKGQLEGYNTVTWSYGKNYDNEAIAWLTLYASDGSDNIVSYQIHNSKSYNVIKNQVTAYKMKSISSKIGDNEISSIYQGKNFVVTISINSSDDKSNPQYLFAVMSNKTYAFIKLQDFLDKMDESPSDSSEEDNLEYDDNFLYKSKAFSYAAVFRDSGLAEKIYMVPPDHFVYVISEYSDNKVRVFCNGRYGYMQETMLNR